ncbi:MAG: GTP-binding protein [Syntrophomonadaceae bacterium]|jgi:Ni2+-binding GTPase involved in maturation of urease and hydrogenase
MKMLSVCGPPSSGKSSVIIKAIEVLQHQGLKIGVVKFDCLTTFDDMLYRGKGIKVEVGLSGSLCPDHFFVSNIEACHQWGTNKGLDLLISESAGLCNRCSPHIKDVLAVCVIDNLMGVNTPGKIGPMLKFADIVVITKGDIVSQAEREVFAFRVRQVNPRAIILPVNGITGQGASRLARLFREARDIDSLQDRQLRYSMPSALCSYCLGEMKIGDKFQMGSGKKMKFHEVLDERL